MGPSASPPPLLPILEGDIRQRLDTERARLRREAGLRDIQHFHRPRERPFLAQERDKVTILMGGLTSSHEALIRAVFQGNGYQCEALPMPDAAACQLGKEYGNNGQCNPSYFTLGSLIQFLQRLQARGISRQDIIDNYVFFTAGACGPCRFGMYEAEYRYALHNAGFEGFRVLIFQQAAGIKAQSGEPGLKFTLNFGMGMLNALHLGDVLNDLVHQIRPFEVKAGETDRVSRETLDRLCRLLREREPFEFMRDAPAWLTRRVGGKTALKNTLSVACKVYDHLYGQQYLEALEECREQLNTIEVDRTILKPVVKITGEFWAQITEGDGNFQMFRFLESEGAEVVVEPIATWVAYMLHLARLQWRRDSDSLNPVFRWGQIRPWLAHQARFRKRMAFLTLGEGLWTYFYHRAGEKLGGITHSLVSQRELVRLAHPFFPPLMRGGEGYMEVGKNIYYTEHRLCHMVLALKPFGCMPSAQSDGVQSAVMARFKDMIFLPIETSGEGEMNARSRVQMALSDAKTKARAEFETVLKSTGKGLDDIREYVASHPELRQPFYRFPHQPGIAGTAAQFILHVSGLMDQRSRLSRTCRSAVLDRASS
jgi:predicted nucleotide-binding protein (sugar kinase/HSP70/actin superfamily)